MQKCHYANESSIRKYRSVIECNDLSGSHTKNIGQIQHLRPFLSEKWTGLQVVNRIGYACPHHLIVSTLTSSRASVKVHSFLVYLGKKDKKKNKIK